MFELVSKFNPSGNHPTAIEKLVNEINKGEKNQVLMGVTGASKTFTMANVIVQVNWYLLTIKHLPDNCIQSSRSFFQRTL